MAEAIGLAASVVGLVQFTGSVFKLVSKFCREAKDAPSKAQELAGLIRDLAGMVESLRLVGSSLEIKNENSFLKPRHLQSFEEALTKISSRLNQAQADFESKKAVKKVYRHLRWPFSLPETKDLVADLEQHRANIQLALSADTMDTLLDILEGQATMQKAIERKLSFDTRVQLNKKRKDVINFFLRVNPQEYLDLSSELRHEATGLWLSDRNKTFSDWKNGTNSRLWLSGIPGSGKTVLCGLVIETILQDTEETTAVCYAFCDYKNPSTCLPRNIIAALAVQLGLQGEEAFDDLEAYYDELHSDDKLPGQPKLDELLDLFKRSADTYDKVFLVVDGLDECGDHISEVTLKLKSLVDECSSVSAAFFSRKEDEIRIHLEDEFEHIEVCADLKDLEDYTVKEVGKRQELKRLKHTNPDLYKDILHTLVHGAQGMFRWVACQIDHICDQPSNRARKLALKRLPPTLFATYDRVLQKLTHYDAETQVCIRKVLQWTALGEPRIPIPALCEGASIREDDDDMDEDDVTEPDAISRLCSCLIRKSLDGKYFEFAHFTVLEYLKTEQAGEFRYLEQVAYRSFSETAIRFLSFREFDRVPRLSQEAERTYQGGRDQKHPFYQVAAAVPGHFQQKNYPYAARRVVLEEEPVLSLLKQLFDMKGGGQFRTWMCTCVENNYLDDDAFHATLKFGPLFMASIMSSPLLCEFLLQKGADVNEIIIGVTPLHISVRLSHDQIKNTTYSDSVWTRRQIETCNMLLDYGADVSSTSSDKSCLAEAFDLLPAPLLQPFIRATISVPEDAVKAFSDRAWDSQLDDELLRSILLLAEENGPPQKWKPIVEYASKCSQRQGLSLPVNLPVPTYSDSEYKEELNIAIRNGYPDALRTLVGDPRFPRNAQGCEDPAFELLDSSEEYRFPNCTEVFQILLASGLNPNKLNSSEQTFLHVSCHKSNVELVKLLLSQSADISLKDGYGRTPWHDSAYLGHCEVLELLCHYTSAWDGLAMLDKFGDTPFRLALLNRHVEACLFLLSQSRLRSDIVQMYDTILNDAAMAGSKELFIALSERKGVENVGIESKSSPMHYLSAKCSLEFAQWLGNKYDHLSANDQGDTPFEMFLRRWLEYNHDPEEGDTGIIPLDIDLVRGLLPSNLIVHKKGDSVHAWELICEALSPDVLCRDADTRSTFDNISNTGSCEYWFSDALQDIIDFGVLSSFEDIKGISGVLPLMQSLKQYRHDLHFCCHSVTTLISQVFNASKLSLSLVDCDDSYVLLEKAIFEDEPQMVSTLISYGVDVHRQFPKGTGGDIPRSPFEMACSESKVEVFKAFLNSTSTGSLSSLDPGRETPLELVVEGTGKDKTSIIREIYEQGSPLNSTTSTTPIILRAARKGDWDVVKCLADLGEDIYSKYEDRRGLAYYAILDDDVEMLEWLFSLKPTSAWHETCESRLRDANDELLHDLEATLLHHACASPAAMKCLLEKGMFVNIDITTENGRTPLHHAAFWGSLDCCQLLIDNGSKLTLRDLDMMLPIDYAVDSKNSEVVLLLLESGSPYPRTGYQHDDGKSRGSPSQRATELARRQFFETMIMAGELEQCKTIASHDFPIDMVLPSCGKCTPLFAAIRAGHEDIINWLLERGAKPMNVFCHHNTYEEAVTLAACWLESSDCIGNILATAREHPSLWSMSLTKAIYRAVSRGEVKMLRRILEHLNENLTTYYNAWNGRADIDFETISIEQFRSVFISGTVATGHKTFNKETPLHCAAGMGNLQIMDMLVEQGAKLDALDREQATPLILAAKRNLFRAVRWLIDHGASVNVRDVKGTTAMVHAVLHGNLRMIELLHTASPFAIHVMTPHGSNLLSKHITRGTFEYLTSKGLDFHHCNRNGDSMLNIALGWNWSREHLIRSRLDTPALSKRSDMRTNPLSRAVCSDSFNSIKRFYLSLPPSLAEVLINQESFHIGTPLCTASSRDRVDIVKLLITLGADVEKDGCAFGTPLMCAIACGKLAVVKLLVRAGAKLEYTSEDGIYRSGFRESLPHPDVTRWLLVERFHDQRKLGNGPCDEAALSRPWSGKQAIKVALKNWELRRWGESSLDFCLRLETIKKEYRGRVIRGDVTQYY